jgi:hypothetical protein
VAADILSIQFGQFGDEHQRPEPAPVADSRARRAFAIAHHREYASMRADFVHKPGSGRVLNANAS